MTNNTKQEEEAHLKPGTLKAFAFNALKDAGTAGLTAAVALDKIKAAGGDKEWPKSVNAMLTTVSALRWGGLNRFGLGS